jgi:N-acetylneuraminate lyase
MNQLAGMYAALLTGLTDEGEFSPERQCAINEYVANQGLKGLYVGGSSGESGLLTIEELLDQQKVVATQMQHQDTKLIAHVGAPNLRDSVRLASAAQENGYHAISALPPHAYPFSDSEILQYYQSLLASTDLPLIIYEVPVRTHRALPDHLLLRLLSQPQVVGIKFTSNDLFKLARLKRACPDKLYYFGFDEMYLSAAALGVNGGIGTTYNVLGKLYAQLDAAVQKTDLALARELQVISQDFVTILLKTGVLAGVKLALNEIGVDCGPVRAPFVLQSDEGAAELKSFIQEPHVRPHLNL